MEVVATNEITIWPLRSLFPCQVKPPFGYTDNLGESSAAGRPLQDTDGNIWAGNDPGYNPTNNPNVVIGNVEYDPVIGAIYPRVLLVPHDQAVAGAWIYPPNRGMTGSSGYADPSNPGPYELDAATGNPIVWWGNLNNIGGTFVNLTHAYPATGTGVNFGTNAFVMASAVCGNASPYTYKFTNGDQDYGYIQQYACDTPGSFSLDGTPPVPCQAFLGLLTPYFPCPGTNNAWGDPIGLSFASMRWRVAGSGRSPRWYSVAFFAGGDAEFEYNDQVDESGNPIEAGWTYVDTIKMGSGRANLHMQQQPTEAGGGVVVQGTDPSTLFSAPLEPILNDPTLMHSFEVRLLGGQMQIRLGADDTPYVWPHFQTDSDGNPDWYMDKFQVVGNVVLGVEWAVHLLKFAATSGLLSNPINAGYPVDDSQAANTEFVIHCLPIYAGESDLVDDNVRVKGFLPPGCTVNAEIAGENGTNVFYNLTITNAPTGTRLDNTLTEGALLDPSTAWENLQPS